MMTLLALVLSSLSFAQTTGEARGLAEAALRLELQRDQVSVPPDQLAAMFRDACSNGYRPACEHNTWIKEGKPVPGQVRDAFRPSCEANDPVACLAESWALNQLANGKQSEDDRDVTYREILRIQQGMCREGRGYAPACHDVANLVFESRGITLANPAKGAMLYWDLACNNGEYAACTRVARLLLDGARLKTRRKTAYSYVKYACDNEHWDACFLLAGLNETKWDVSRRDEVYSDLCEKGHVESCYYLARSYYDGVFPEPVEGRGQSMFERACGLEHARSCFESGRGTVDSDIAAARAFFRKACELDDAAGCKAQVDLILERGTRDDVKDNFKAFEVSCDQRQSSTACEWLAYHLLDRDSAQRDFVRGRELLSQVCTDEGSSAEACFALGRCFEEKIGGSRDRTDAVKYYRWACQSGTVEACYRAGLLLEKGEGVQRDDGEALTLFGQACDGGLSDGCTHAGRLLTFSVQIPRSPKLASEWYEKGCDQGNAESCYGLGETLERGIEQPDPTGARVAYQRAINEGLAKARTRKAYLLWNGLGGKKRKGQARQLCREACQAGHDDACTGPDFLRGL